MAQWRKTFDSLGGPTYIADPRVDEQARLGELLLARQRAQGEQQDRLFGRRQQADSLGESKRQFDAELAQRQLEARQRLELQGGEAARAQANADRAFGLDERQAGLAEKRLSQQDEQAFREQAARDSVFYANREDEKRRQLEADFARIDTNAARGETERRADKRLAQQNEIDDRRETGRDARQAAREKAASDRQTAALGASEERQRAQLEAQARLAREREDRLRGEDRADREAEREKIEGTKEQQREGAIKAREARFRAVLAEATAKGALADGDQAKAVARAYAAATSPDTDPQRRTYEAAALGADGEAEANARLAAIVQELFPSSYQFEPKPLRERGFLGGLTYLPEQVADTLTPNGLQDWLARNLPSLDGKLNTGPGTNWTYGSGGQREAQKLFGKKPPVESKATRQRGNVSR